MLTVKLCKGHSTKIIEALDVSVFPCGKTEGSDINPKLRTNSVREIAVRTSEGKYEAFWVGRPENASQCEAGPVDDLYDVAYIENAHGATTETVRPY